MGMGVGWGGVDELHMQYQWEIAKNGRERDSEREREIERERERERDVRKGLRLY